MGELSIGEVARMAGLATSAIRYYEREGLLVEVTRAPSGHRRYDEEDVLWVKVLRCLRDTGMSIDQLRRYCVLGEQGVQTEAERRRILLDHRAEVEAQIDQRRAALVLIDEKLRHYTGEAS